MTESTIFARIFPKSIKIFERYHYQAEIGYTQHMEEKADGDEKTQGRLEIIIPYDGEKYFTTQAAADIQRQSAKIARNEEVNVRIGYLSFAKYKGTGLESNPELQITGDIAPVDLQRHEHQLPNLINLSGNPNSCRIRYTYQPKSPDNIPVKFKVAIADENVFEAPATVWDLLDGRPLTEAEHQRIDERVKGLVQQERLSTDLIFDLQATLKLPDGIGVENDETPPKISRVSIQWPVAVSHNHINLRLMDKDQSKIRIVYNPEQRVIEWRDIPFVSPKKKSLSTGLYFYKTPKMRLTIDQPGELYQMPALEGKLELEILRAFSGLQVKYFSATGQNIDTEQVPVESKTQITVNFNLSLSDSFDHKTLTPYQQLHFEGVVLDEMRIADIENILEHYGFMARALKLNGRSGSLKRYLVVGCQKQTMEQSWIWLLVEGKSSQTMRQKRMPGDHVYSSYMETGQLTIHMRGQLHGDMLSLSNLMSDVQNRLKEQFHYLSIVD